MTTPPFRIGAPSEAQHDVMRRLWLMFQHDMSSFTGGLPDAEGRYRSERLENALAGRPGWQSYLMTSGPHPIGFAVLRSLDEPIHVLSSFFVVAAARRDGVGSRLATEVMAAHPGRWQLAYQDANGGASRFWPSVAASLDPEWTLERRAVPGRPELPPDVWIDLMVAGSR